MLNIKAASFEAGHYIQYLVNMILKEITKS